MEPQPSFSETAVLIEHEITDGDKAATQAERLDNTVPPIRRLAKQRRSGHPTKRWPNIKLPLLPTFFPATGYQSAWAPWMTSPTEVQVMTVIAKEDQARRSISLAPLPGTVIMSSVRPETRGISNPGGVPNPALLRPSSAPLASQEAPAPAPAAGMTAPGQTNPGPVVTERRTSVKSQPSRKVIIASPSIVKHPSDRTVLTTMPRGAPRPTAYSSNENAGIRSPTSPELESEMFEESESLEQPEYELSDTTILDVNPCLLIPLSACNFLLILASAAFFLASLYAYFDRDSSGSTTSSNTWLVYLVLNFQTVLMVASLLLFFVGSVGFLGALRENICLLELYVTMQAVFTAMYTLLILLIFFLPLIGRGFVLSHITPDLILHYRDSDDFRQEIDYVQSSLRCCGMTEQSYRDWNVNPYFNCSLVNPSAERCSVPPSCCRTVDEEGLDDYADPHSDFRREALAVKDTEPKNDEEDPVIGTTLCGRGVMNMTEQAAWKRIYTRGCGSAMFQYVSSRVTEIILFSLLLILIHLILMTLAVAVRGEIKVLAKVYDRYYKALNRGQKLMGKLSDQEQTARDAESREPEIPLVSSREERRMKHRRRYLHHEPAWKRFQEP